MENIKHMKDSMEILRLSGFTVDGDSSKIKRQQEYIKRLEEQGAHKQSPSSYQHLQWERAKQELKQMLGDSESKDEDPDIKYKNFMAGKKKPLTYSEGKKLLEEAKKAGIHPDYLKGMERGLSSLSKDSCGEKVFTKGTEDAEEQWITMKGAHVKIDEGESKESATKEFIKKKGGNPAPEDIKYDEKEIEKIKAKWKGKKSEAGYGSEYGDILNHLRKEASKAGKLPDMDKYYELGDKLIEMRSQGKKDTPEYKEMEKQKNDFNKNYRKIQKSLEEKAKSLSSEGEQKRLDEIKQFAKKNKINQDSAIQVECNEILRLSGFIS